MIVGHIPMKPFSQLAVETLDDFEISIPSSSSGKSTAFKKNGVTYSVSSIDAEQLETSSVPAAAEMQSLTCLLPSQSRNGQLYPGQYLDALQDFASIMITSCDIQLQNRFPEKLS